MRCLCTRKALSFLLMFFVAVLLESCQDYRNMFNPIQVLCPGDFDPAKNRCVGQTHGDGES